MAYLSEQIRSEFESTFDCIIDYYVSYFDVEKSLRDNFEGSINALGEYFRRCSNSAYMLEKIRAGALKLGWLMRDEVIKDVENGRYHRESELAFEDRYRSIADRDVIFKEVEEHVESMRVREPLVCYEARKNIISSDEGRLSYKTWFMDKSHPVSLEAGKLEVLPKCLQKALVHTAVLFDICFVEPVVVAYSSSQFIQDEVVKRFNKNGIYSPRDVYSGGVEGTKFDVDLFLQNKDHRYWFEKVSASEDTRSFLSLIDEFKQSFPYEGKEKKLFLNPDLWTNG